MRPLPNRFHDLVSKVIKKNRKRRFSIDNLGDDFKDALPHIVFKKPDIKEIKGNNHFPNPKNNNNVNIL